MTIFLLHDGMRAERIHYAVVKELSAFRCFLKDERVFYDGDKFGNLLLHHYDFLMQFSYISPDNEVIDSFPQTRLPLLHCLRADIKDLCACCPFVGACDKQVCSVSEFLGRRLASQLICDIYVGEQRRLHKYLDMARNKSLRYLSLIQKCNAEEKNTLVATINKYRPKGNEEAHMAWSCKETLHSYMHTLSVHLH